MALFRYIVYLTAQLFYLGVCLTHLLQRGMLSLKQNRLVRVVIIYFSQSTNQQNIFLLSSKSPRKHHIQGIPLATWLLLLLLVGGPQGVQKHRGTIVLVEARAELNTVLLKYWMASPNRPKIGNSEQMQCLRIFNYLGSIWPFVYLKILSFNSNQRKGVLVEGENLNHIFD